ncbi:MAG: o-succinylbenzoate synthase [Flavobacteriales bacterium]|jgi:o-succinylbenzoate synthase
MDSCAIRIVHRPLAFARPAGTSRGVLTEKPSWFLIAHHPDGRQGVGECSLIPGLSPEHPLRAARALEAVAASGTLDVDAVPEHLPAVRFAVETALIDLLVPGEMRLFDSLFADGAEGIPINGLVWMDGVEAMWEAAGRLVSHGFTTLKFKVGALDFGAELDLLTSVRRAHPDCTLRVDANGSFSSLPEGEALRRCEALADLGVHSIEQPLRAGRWVELAALCRTSPLPIALDEELIGLTSTEVRRAMLHTVRPAYIVLKPSLIGGLREANAWVDLASEVGAGWWATSALESNVGLNAIAQWTADALSSVPAADRLPQGLGTGGLFTNNLASPLAVRDGGLWIDHGPQATSWSLP